MNDPLRKYWEIRLNRVKENLEKNNFEAYVAESAEQAKSIVVDKIMLSLKPSTVSFGGSVTVVQTGIYDALKRAENIEIIDTYDMSLSPKERINQRKRALLADLFITGTNAVVENGMLVNLDGMGNRIAAITFGPRHVIIVVGRNKVVFDLEEALQRVKEIAAPANAIRLNRKTPCAKTGQCEDCSSPERICNVWSIVEKSAPKGRIKVILVNDDLGF